MIADHTFFLNINHSSVAELEQAHTGPWMWSSLVEYFPNKQIETGETFRGYENPIIRGNSAYNVIVTSSQPGATNPELQREIVTMLQSIRW